MNDEGEKSKVKQRGDSVTFRLLKKMKYSNNVLELINKSTEEGKCNEEVIKALDFYVRFSHREKEIKLLVQYMDKLENPIEFSEKVIEQLYTQYIKEQLENEDGEEQALGKNEENNILSNVENKNIDNGKGLIDEKEITSEVRKNNLIKLNINSDNNETSDEEDVFGDVFGSNMAVKGDTAVGVKGGSLAKAMASIQRKRG